MGYQEENSKAIDRWIEEGWEWGKPISHQEYLNAKKGAWDVLLTPTKKMPHEWLGELKDKTLLGLASGGGQQMPIFTALGAKCTVIDYSKKQIESEFLVAKRENYEIIAIQGDITKTLPFEDESFDIIFNPVSLCYIEDVKSVFKECFRVLKHGGIFVTGFDNGINYFVGDDEKQIIQKMPFNPLKNKDQMKFLKDADAGIQFSHTLEELIGGQLQAGFRLVDLYEDTNGEGYLEELKINTYIATKSIKD